jgi:hypothetical protein
MAAGPLIAGCGGGSTPAHTATSARSATVAKASGSKASLTRDQLIAAAEPICRRLDRALSATENAKPSADANARMREIVRIDPSHAVLEQKVATELAKLSPPPSLAHDWAQIVSYRSRLAGELARLARAAARKDTTEVNGLAKSKKEVHVLLRKLATRDGFKECGDARPVSSSAAGAPIRARARADVCSEREYLLSVRDNVRTYDELCNRPRYAGGGT